MCHQAPCLMVGTYGIPPLFVRLIQFFHGGIKVEVSVDDATTPVIEVNNDLCRAVPLPHLFSTSTSTL